jgi:hypothetical protein
MSELKDEILANSTFADSDFNALKANLKIMNFEAALDKSLAAKAKDARADTSVLERQIDNFVYRLYNLTYDEVKVIELDSPLSEAEYEGIEVDE